MKTFNQFCEQAGYDPFNRTPNVGDRLRQFGSSVQSKINQLRNNPTLGRVKSALLANPRTWESQAARKDLGMQLRGVNPDNPSRMPVTKTKDSSNYSVK